MRSQQKIDEKVEITGDQSLRCASLHHEAGRGRRRVGAVLAKSEALLGFSDNLKQ
jgi:hypothetical protein